MGAKIREWFPGKGDTRGKTEEINELKRLKDRVRRLETALADANIEIALERAYTQLACKRAGVDPEEFKKKAAGQRRTQP